MTTFGQIERATQNRVVKLFSEQLGFSCLGNWEDRLNNRNIEEIYIHSFLKGKLETNAAQSNKEYRINGEESVFVGR
jgi:type I restriction enzyme, R subunit